MIGLFNDIATQMSDKGTLHQYFIWRQLGAPTVGIWWTPQPPFTITWRYISVVVAKKMEERRRKRRGRAERERIESRKAWEESTAKGCEITDIFTKHTSGGRPQLAISRLLSWFYVRTQIMPWRKAWRIKRCILFSVWGKYLQLIRAARDDENKSSRRRMRSVVKGVNMEINSFINNSLKVLLLQPKRWHILQGY